jgi:tRNA(Ile)-lysidine synthase
MGAPVFESGLHNAPAANPLTLIEFDAALRQTGFDGHALGLAVSGGPDSMAMALLAAEWARAQSVELVAFTLDHALRPESAAEAKQVQSWLQARGIHHEILRWEHPPLTVAIQEQARHARYEALTAACRRQGLRALLLAHQQEDQAETVLLRFAKGTGIDGLAAMQPVTMWQGVALLRPLLQILKARLIATCDTFGQAYIRDSSNEAKIFARGRLRAAAEVLAAEGMNAARLGDLAARASLARDALEIYANRLLAQAVFWHPAGYAEIHLMRFEQEPLEIRLRVLRCVLTAIGGGSAPPRQAAMLELEQALQNPRMKSRTLSGCLWRYKQGSAFVMREFAAISDAAPIAAGESRIWDGRFAVTVAEKAPTGLHLAALGQVPQAILSRIAPEILHAVPQSQIRATLPALWQGEELIAAASFEHERGLLYCRWAGCD